VRERGSGPEKEKDRERKRQKEKEKETEIERRRGAGKDTSICTICLRRPFPYTAAESRASAPIVAQSGIQYSGWYTSDIFEKCGRNCSMRS